MIFRRILAFLCLASASFAQTSPVTITRSTQTAVYPATGTLTLITPLSLGTSNALTVGTIEIGHASQNTLSAASGVLSIEGKTVLDQTNTLAGITNKTFVAPVLGAATGTSVALGGATIGSNAFAATGTGFISGTMTLGDGSAATAILASNLSGATDPTITFGNATVTVSASTDLVSPLSFMFSGASGNGTGFVNSSDSILLKQNSSVAKFYFGNSSSFRTISGNTIGWVSGSDATAALDTILGRGGAAATVQMGADAAGVVTPQTFKGPNRITSDGVGGDLIIAGGKNRGASAGGSVITQTSAPAAATVTGTLANRGYVYGGEKTLTESTATIVANITLAAGTYTGGKMLATTHADDATDFQAITDEFTFAAVNKGGTVTATIQAAPSTSTTAASSVATLATTWTIVVNGNSVDIKNSAVSSLTQTTLAASWQLQLNGNAAQVVTP